VISPHPDDEILGLGGSILKMLDEGAVITVLYLTDGDNSRVWFNKEEIKRQRKNLSKQICKCLNIKESNIIRFHLADGYVPHPDQPGFNALVKSIKEIIESLKSEAVFCTHVQDYWPYDHVACSYAAEEAIKLSFVKPILFSYWVWAWYNMKPWAIKSNSYKKLYQVNIKKELPRKVELMNLYLKTLTPSGKPWSGILPEPLIKALSSPIEVLEKIS
jgi:LmbE family N-acetylglucosaminyl deacetylase